ncbi:MAG: low-complexity tail membrane protein [Cyanobacteriota bacterium]|nr:low-complexity tail membrane protein [Cyanobacteriota bacterium]
MRKVWQEPFLWVHLAGLLAVPFWVALTLIGLATSDPLLPVGLERLLVGLAGTLPVAWMQANRPFYIFSILVVALDPAQLSLQRRRILSAFLGFEEKLLALLVSLLLLQLAERFYQIAPLFQSLSPIHLGVSSRLLGLLIASVGFWGLNLFVQVPVAVLRILLLSDPEFEQLSPFAVDQVANQFTIIGQQRTDLWVTGDDPVPEPPSSEAESSG